MIFCVIYFIAVTNFPRFFFLKEINGITKIKDGYNPANWMLEITSAAQEEALGVNFTDIYKNSELYR